MVKFNQNLIINIIEGSGIVQQEETMNIEELFFKLKATSLNEDTSE